MRENEFTLNISLYSDIFPINSKYSDIYQYVQNILVESMQAFLRVNIHDKVNALTELCLQ